MSDDSPNPPVRPPRAGERRLGLLESDCSLILPRSGPPPFVSYESDRPELVEEVAQLIFRWRCLTEPDWDEPEADFDPSYWLSLLIESQRDQLRDEARQLIAVLKPSLVSPGGGDL